MEFYQDWHWQQTSLITVSTNSLGTLRSVLMTKLKVLQLLKKDEEILSHSLLLLTDRMKLGNRRHKVIHLQAKVTALTQNAIYLKQLKSKKASGYKVIMRRLSDRYERRDAVLEYIRKSIFRLDSKS